MTFGIRKRILIRTPLQRTVCLLRETKHWLRWTILISGSGTSMTDTLSVTATSSRVSPTSNNNKWIEISTSAPHREASRRRVLMDRPSTNWMILGLYSTKYPILPSEFSLHWLITSSYFELFSRYWSVKRMELKAMLENVGPFHIFFTLSCGDRRYLKINSDLM